MAACSDWCCAVPEVGRITTLHVHGARIDVVFQSEEESKDFREAVLGRSEKVFSLTKVGSDRPVDVRAIRVDAVEW